MTFLLAMLVNLLALASSQVRGDILRWDNGQVIPGTEGITPGPGVNLGSRQLEYAELSGVDLTDAFLRGAVLTDAKLDGAKLIRANLSPATLRSASFAQADLTSAYLAYADLTGADFSYAIVTDAVFECFSGCLTQAQLASTASYQAKDLRGIELSYVGLQGWDLHDQNLTGLILRDSSAANADFSGANLSGAHIESITLTNADFSGAIINGALIARINFSAFYDQFRSTASYQNKDLRGIRFSEASLMG